ncbi:MAG: TerD family protein [Clostridiales bacterium]|nr:TerD family protein [Clostridiales bacterium]
MPVNLSKGQKVDLTKTNPGLQRLHVGLGWDTNRYDGGYDFDLDAVTFMLQGNGKVGSDDDFVFFGNKRHASGAVESMGDNLTGAGDGDDEVIKVNLALLPAHIERVTFAVCIYDPEVRHQNFGQVENAFIRIVNEDNGEELIHFDLGEDFSIETSVVVGELYRYNGEWKFNAIGSGFQGGLAALCVNYGVNV